MGKIPKAEPFAPAPVGRVGGSRLGGSTRLESELGSLAAQACGHLDSRWERGEVGGSVWGRPPSLLARLLHASAWQKACGQQSQWFPGSPVWGAQGQMPLGPWGHTEPGLASTCSRRGSGDPSGEAKRLSDAWESGPQSGLWGSLLTFSTARTAPGRRWKQTSSFPGRTSVCPTPTARRPYPSRPQAPNLPGSQEMLGVWRARGRREPWEG